MGNYAARFYVHAMHTDGPVRRLQRTWQARLQDAVREVEAKVMAALGSGRATHAAVTTHAKVRARRW